MTPERLIIESLFRIPNKDGEDVDFILNKEQAELDESLTGRDIVPKARQLGISTYFIARQLARCLSMRNRRCVVISHETDATQRLLGRAHYIIKHLKCDPPELKYANRNEIVFEKTDSSFYIGTAGSKNFGHGDTVSDLHCSEVARWPDPQDLLKGLFQAVPPSGNISIESTGNGTGNWYHRACTRAAKSQSGYKLHFFNWLERPEYQLQMSPGEIQNFLAGLKDELEEPEYLKRGISPERLMWRRMKLAEMDFDLQAFKEQFPTTLDECFQARGHSYFTRVNYQPTSEWKRHDFDSYMWVLGDHPRPGRIYAIGGDVGAGVGRDSSTMEVIDVEACEQVGEWVSNKIEPDIYAAKVRSVAQLFNDAYVNIERNNHGILVVKILMDTYDRNLLHKGKVLSSPSKEYGRISDYGTYTSEVTKHLMLGNLRAMLVKDLIVHSELLKSELDTFVEKENGKLEAEEGCHDDLVMGLAQGAFVLPKAAQYGVAKHTIPEQQRGRDPFSLDSIIEEMQRKRQGELPISPGVL
jgi:hypothetical protein